MEQPPTDTFPVGGPKETVFVVVKDFDAGVVTNQADYFVGYSAIVPAKDIDDSVSKTIAVFV